MIKSFMFGLLQNMSVLGSVGVVAKQNVFDTFEQLWLCISNWARHMSDLHRFERIHIHRKAIWSISRTPLYINICMICIIEIIYTI